MIVDPSKLHRLRGNGNGSIDLEFSTDCSYALSAAAVKFTAGSTSASMTFKNVPEDAASQELTLFTITAVGGGGSDVFFRIPDEELRHWSFLVVEPHLGLYGDKLKIEWTGVAADEWYWMVDLLCLG